MLFRFDLLAEHFHSGGIEMVERQQFLEVAHDERPWRLFDGAGRQLSSGQLDATSLRLPPTGLPKGLLWLEVRSRSG